MELYLTDGRQVFFPGTVVRGTLRVVRPDANDDVPAVKASGYTLVWKPAARNEEIDERTVFYEDTAVTCPEANDAREPSTTTGTGIRLVLGPRSRMSGDHLNTENACLSGRSKTFEFHLVLPSDLPPSHEVPFGHTRYKLEAHYNGQTVVRHFCVGQWVGLKKRDNKIVKRNIFSVSFNFCQPIEIILNLNQSYYLPGEIVHVGAMITNNSWEDVIFTKISIIQTTKYWKIRHLLPIKHVRIIAEGIRGLLRSGQRQVWYKQPLYIPAVIPTTSTSNNPFNFFEVSYKLKMNIKLRSSNKNIALKQKLFIGNWDKSTANNKKSVNSVPPKINDSSQEIAFESCSFCKLENIDFIPTYMVYKTNQE